MKTQNLRFATFTDTTPMPEVDTLRAEWAFEQAIVEVVTSAEMIRHIQRDNTEALEGGLERFENCSSAWDKLTQVGERAAEAALGYWPGGAAHFEVSL